MDYLPGVEARVGNLDPAAAVPELRDPLPDAAQKTHRAEPCAGPSHRWRSRLRDAGAHETHADPGLPAS
ncbi:MAG: hypothetical protein M5R38_04230 [Candidatus Methylomirabilis sp.]|nr:hypothetical protein [Candidatus Methylomirabilis sp.]